MKNHQILILCSTMLVCTTLLAENPVSQGAAALLSALSILGFFVSLYHEK